MLDLAELTRRAPLGASWGAPELYRDTVEVGAVSVERVGLVARRGAEEVTGSAASFDGAPALPRAYFELLERVALFEAAGRSCDLRDLDDRAHGTLPSGAVGAAAPGATSWPARSSGVAFRDDWRGACRHAWLELVERDRLLRSWSGAIAPTPLGAPSFLRAAGDHDWRAAIVAAEPGAAVAVVIGFPRHASLPLARGYAAGDDVDDALEHAAREALQSLAFLWDEPVPSAPPPVAPTPMFHLDYYLVPRHHDALRAWLAGARGDAGAPPLPDDVRYADLTPDWMRGARVARAVSERAEPLTFGIPRAAEGVLSDAWSVHPVA